MTSPELEGDPEHRLAELIQSTERISNDPFWLPLRAWMRSWAFEIAPSPFSPMCGRIWLNTLAFILTQHGAVVLGVAWGLRIVRCPTEIPRYHVIGGLCVFSLLTESLYYTIVPVGGTRRARVVVVCGTLCAYAALIMKMDPFVLYFGDISFAWDVALLSPFLIFNGLLFTSSAWLALFASQLFLATSLTMVVANACSGSGLTGFFYCEVF